jgi:hypothetical protein
MTAAARKVWQKSPNWTFFGNRKFCFFKVNEGGFVGYSANDGIGLGRIRIHQKKLSASEDMGRNCVAD